MKPFRLFSFTVLALIAVSACRANARIDTPVEEVMLSDRVEARLEADEDLDDAEIRAETEDGVVMLVGVVRSSRDRDEAASLTRSTPGVVDVLNRLRIGHGDRAPTVPPGPSDDEDSAESMQDPSGRSSTIP